DGSAQCTVSGGTPRPACDLSIRPGLDKLRHFYLQCVIMGWGMRRSAADPFRFAGRLPCGRPIGAAPMSIRQARPFVRDGAIIFVTLAAVELIPLVGGWVVHRPHGPASIADAIESLGRIVAGAAFI